MKTNVKIMIPIILIVMIQFNFCSCSQNNNLQQYQPVCRAICSELNSQDKWNFIIYLDIDACLDCTEDVESWLKLEKIIPSHGGVFSLWTNKKDSADIAIGLALEGIKTKILVLNDSLTYLLENDLILTPIKFLTDNKGHLIKKIAPFSSSLEAKEFYEKILSSLEKKNND